MDVNRTVTRFPSQALENVLLAQVQEIIPLVKIQPRQACYPVIYVSDHPSSATWACTDVCVKSCETPLANPITSPICIAPLLNAYHQAKGRVADTKQCKSGHAHASTTRVTMLTRR